MLPWLGESASVSPLEPNQTQFLLRTSCTTSAQCPSGQSCNCGQCHFSCNANQRWSCTCQICYNRCPNGYFFDDSLCACSPI